MNAYQREQSEALQIVRRYLHDLPVAELAALNEEVAAYLDFRSDVQSFLEAYFGGTCTRTCFQNRRSACCSREGIIIFFADVVVNVLISDAGSLERLEAVLATENRGYKCIYLGERGCLWTLKPIVCQMFLCDSAEKEVFGRKPALRVRWNELCNRRKDFTWPDKPVLFDDLERRFIETGLHSTLMYLHNSPGLLRVKKGR